MFESSLRKGVKDGGLGAERRHAISRLGVGSEVQVRDEGAGCGR